MDTSGSITDCDIEPRTPSGGMGRQGDRTMTKIEKRPDDVLNADEVSAWLKIPKSTLYKLCSEGQIPAGKIGRHWRFHRETLEKWFLDQASTSGHGKERPQE